MGGDDGGKGGVERMGFKKFNTDGGKRGVFGRSSIPQDFTPQPVIDWFIISTSVC